MATISTIYHTIGIHIVRYSTHMGRPTICIERVTDTTTGNLLLHGLLPHPATCTMPDRYDASDIDSTGYLSSIMHLSPSQLHGQLFYGICPDRHHYSHYTTNYIYGTTSDCVLPFPAFSAYSYLCSLSDWIAIPILDNLVHTIPYRQSPSCRRTCTTADTARNTYCHKNDSRCRLTPPIQFPYGMGHYSVADSTHYTQHRKQFAYSHPTATCTGYASFLGSSHNHIVSIYSNQP